MDSKGEGGGASQMKLVSGTSRYTVSSHSSIVEKLSSYGGKECYIIGELPIGLQKMGASL